LPSPANTGVRVDHTEDLDARLQRSVKTLRAWRWMSRISTNRAEVAALLRAEARALIQIGRDNPDKAKDIGKLIVAYHKLILQMKCPAGAGSEGPDAESVAVA
jgi:hypothetical protein